MNKFYYILAIIVTVLVFSLVLIGAVKPPPIQNLTGNKITVAATIFPLADIARNIGGNKVDVLLIIPPGLSEHSNALSPQQLLTLQSARVIFRIGHGLDDRIAQRVQQTIPSATLVTVDKGIALQEFKKELQTEDNHDNSATAEEHRDSGTDPHYWLTVPNAMIIASTITDELIAIDPAKATYYQQNLSAYQEQLSQLENTLQAKAKAITAKEFITVHNAWSYLAEHYHLHLVATYEPVEGQSPSLSDLGRLRDIVKEYDLKTFYTEPQKMSPTIVNLMRQEFGLQTLTLDPVGGRGDTGSYIDLMLFNLQSLTDVVR